MTLLGANTVDLCTLSDLLPEWQLDAACRGANNDWFFVDTGGATSKAKALCASCRVRQECLDYAIAENLRHGIFGGLSERARRRVQLEREKAKHG